MEQIDILDDRGKLTQKKATRFDIHNKGLWHRIVIVLIMKNGSLMIQKRAKNKHPYAGFWDLSVCGHVDAGEEPAVAAAREVEEETGITLGEKELTFLKVVKNSHLDKEANLLDNVFAYLYKIEINKETEVELGTDEVECIEFIKLNELEIQLNNNSRKFMAWGELWKEVIKVLINA